jgi:hypothetical protein
MNKDDKNVLDFDSIKQSHAFNRKESKKESKIDAIRNAFKLSREEANPKPKKGKKKRKKKKR